MTRSVWLEPPSVRLSSLTHGLPPPGIITLTGLHFHESALYTELLHTGFAYWEFIFEGCNPIFRRHFKKWYAGSFIWTAEKPKYFSCEGETILYLKPEGRLRYKRSPDAPRILGVSNVVCIPTQSSPDNHS